MYMISSGPLHGSYIRSRGGRMQMFYKVQSDYTFGGVQSTSLRWPYSIFDDPECPCMELSCSFLITSSNMSSHTSTCLIVTLRVGLKQFPFNTPLFVSSKLRFSNNFSENLPEKVIWLESSSSWDDEDHLWMSRSLRWARITVNSPCGPTWFIPRWWREKFTMICMK